MNRSSLRPVLLLAVMLAGLSWAQAAHSFCGFYVATGDARIFNRASRVVLVRDGDRTVMTMANDFRGDPKQFAIVVPVPTVLERDQVHAGDPALLDHIDAYSAPRLVEYFDGNPCNVAMEDRAQGNMRMLASAPASKTREKSLGVTIEARYTVGEYDILILSASQSAGLETWLKAGGYRIPTGASRVLGAYIKQGLKFFVAKVNLTEQHKLGFTNLRPIQIAYESPRFMLPIRLGMVNADGPQELLVYALTRRGRGERANYRAVKIPTDVDVPECVKETFPDVYRALFARAVENEGGAAVFTEYAWDMSWCDPCASEPLSNDELRQLGVFWLGEPARPGQPGGVFITRLHARYDRAHFPEDLVFQETADRANFQGRYIMHHPWKGGDECPGAGAYRAELRVRREREARTLATLTGWSVDSIRQRMRVAADWSAPGDSTRWWQSLWK